MPDIIRFLLQNGLEINQVGSDSASKLDNQNLLNHISARRANHVLEKFDESELTKS